MLHAIWRTADVLDRPRTVDEAEMDMNRNRALSAGRPRTHLSLALVWLGGRSRAIAAPRRSVDRELQENWPVSDY